MMRKKYRAERRNIARAAGNLGRRKAVAGGWRNWPRQTKQLPETARVVERKA